MSVQLRSDPEVYRETQFVAHKPSTTRVLTPYLCVCLFGTVHPVNSGETEDGASDLY